MRPSQSTGGQAVGERDVVLTSAPRPSGSARAGTDRRRRGPASSGSTTPSPRPARRPRRRGTRSLSASSVTLRHLHGVEPRRRRVSRGRRASTRAQSFGPRLPSTACRASRRPSTTRGRALPRAELRVVGAVVSAAAARSTTTSCPLCGCDDDRLVVEPLHERRSPRPRRSSSPSGRRPSEIGDRRDQREIRVRVGLRLGFRRPRHVVADAEHLQVLHAEVEVVRATRTRARAPGSTGAAASSLTVRKWNDVVADDSK